MGKVLQKKKSRSSVPKVKHRGRAKKPAIQSNAIIAAHWNRDETLSQNYRRLGLAAKLNRLSGGAEKGKGGGDSSRPASANRAALSIRDGSKGRLTAGEARVERDPETGRIISVISTAPEMGEERDDGEHWIIHDPLADIPETASSAWQGVAGGAQGLNVTNTAEYNSTPHTLITQLEHQAAAKRQARTRRPGERERAWLADLQAKHGNDYAAMARDMKLNPRQQTAGDLRKRVEGLRTAE